MQLRKKLAIGVAVTATLALGTAAFAFWTTTGGGTGAGRTADAVEIAPIEVVGGVLTPALSPLAASTLPVALHNPNAFSVGVGEISAEATVRWGVGETPVDCGIVVEPTTLSTPLGPNSTANTNDSAEVTLNVAFGESADNQNLCLDHAIDFAVTVAAPTSA